MKKKYGIRENKEPGFLRAKTINLKTKTSNQSKNRNEHDLFSLFSLPFFA